MSVRFLLFWPEKGKMVEPAEEEKNEMGKMGELEVGSRTVCPVSAVRKKKMGSQVLAGDWRKEIKTSGEGRLRLDRGLKKKKRGASNVKKKIKTRGRACLAFGWRMIGGTQRKKIQEKTGVPWFCVFCKRGAAACARC